VDEAERAPIVPGSGSLYRTPPHWLIRSTRLEDSGPPTKPPVFFFFDRFNTSRSIAVWIGLHVVLGQLVKASPTLATVHGLGTAAICIYLALTSDRIMIVLAMMGYAACGDVLWRMTGAHVPWELSKYLVVVTSVIVLIRWIGRPRSGFATAIMILLLPALVPTIQPFGLSHFRDRFSFVLLGLFALAVSSMVTRRLRCDWEEIRVLLWGMLGPIITVTSIAASAVSKLNVSAFKSIQSNTAASGGFGANQVSSILGLGTLLCLYIALQDNNWVNRLMCIALGSWCLGQCVITLSRGGMANVALAVLLAAPHLLLHEKLGLRLLVGFTMLAMVVGLVVLPRLDALSGGAVQKRFKDGNTTERGQLAGIDMELFASHPVFGVGVGVSDKSHRIGVDGSALASHTEFTRLLAEHGLFGIGVILSMLGLAIEAYRRQTNWFGRAWTVSLVGWTAMDLTHASTRNAINGFVFAMAMFAIDEHSDHEVEPDLGPVPERSDAAEPSPDSTARQLLSQDVHRAHRAYSRPNRGSSITFDLPDH